MYPQPDDAHFMQQALSLAAQAFEAGEVPIGAIVVLRNRIVGRGHNQTERLKDPTAHAEMLAITAAAQTLGSSRLRECTLYVTIEPCPMCAAATQWAQLARIVYGAPEQKHGYSRLGPAILHPKTTVHAGVMAHEARQLMQDFFAAKRP